VVLVGESGGRAWTEKRENIQNIGVDVLIRFKKREVRKASTFMTGLGFFYPVC
jgi:hypothetical protein